MSRILTHLLTAVAAAGITWFALKHHHSSASASPGNTGRKVLFYQSPMHPWVKSDDPGRCTVCGMLLVPVYEGESGPGGAASDLVMLPEGSPTAANVKTATVFRGPLQHTLKVAGVIEDDDSRHRILSAYTGGRIEKLHVNFEGAEVTSGQPLVTIFSRELLAAAGEYRLLSRQAGSDLAAISLKLRQYGLTDAQIQNIPSRAETDLTFDLLAPMSGTVVKRSAYEGQYVAEGAPLFELADFSTMWFQFIAYEQDLPFLRVGQPVELAVPSQPGKAIPAVIKFINPTVDMVTRSARVRVEVPNGERHLRHRVYAEATVKLDAPEVTAVPRAAVLWSGGVPRAYVEESPGAYQVRGLKLGRVGDDAWEVADGLAVGESVVVSGNMLIDSQAQLNSVAPAADPSALPMPTVAPPIADAALKQWDDFLRAAGKISAALAADDLKGYNASVAALPAPPDSLAAVVPPAPAADLKSARRSFLPWSLVIADAALGLREKLAGLRVLQCPMTADLWQGAPPKARWIQFSSDTRNPYWGAEMLDCGSDVK